MELLDRIAAALEGGRETPTDVLTALLQEAGGETCWRRPRLVHRLTAILHSTRPPMATSTTHRFKPGFAHKDFTGASIIVGDQTKIVKASNLTDEDVPLLQQYGYGHLIEPISTKAPAEAPQTTDTGILQTAVEVTEDSVIIKHSSGGPDDLPITAPAAQQADAATPEKREQPELKPAKPAATEPIAPKADKKHK
jgi:hypothetical protein